MITEKKIDEWLQEVEERPWSAHVIIHSIASRLNHLTKWNEELLAENIQLRAGEKVDEYEKRIANLEYQLELLKRQFAGEIPVASERLPASAQNQEINLILYHPQGKILRFALNSEEFVSSNEIASFRKAPWQKEDAPHLLVTSSSEELLLLFDSGRTVVHPAAEIPASDLDRLEWEQALFEEPRAGERLAAIVPVAKMSLFEFCLQFSRKGYVKKIREDFFETYLSNQYLGTGTKLKFDKTCGLLFCNSEEQLVLATKEGYLFRVDVNKLPLAIEEVVRLNSTDYVIAAFIARRNHSILAVTQNGKLIHRETDWLEPAEALNTKGQPLFSKSRRDSGVHLVGAASVSEQDWCLACTSNGKLISYRIGDLFASGALLPRDSQIEVVEIATFQIEDSKSSD